MTNTANDVKAEYSKSLDLLRAIDDPSHLKIFMHSAPFKTMGDTYAHLIDGLFITKTAAEIGAFFGLPEFVAADLQAGALANASQRATMRSTLPGDSAASLMASLLGGLTDKGEEKADPIGEAIAKTLKENGVNAKVRTETVEIPAALGKIFMSALAKKRAARGEPLGCQDPACGTCQVGNAMKAAHEGGDISVEEILLFASDEKRQERTERMGEQIIAGRPALDVIRENVEELRRAAAH